MNSVLPAAFLVPVIFCSSISGQTAQPFSVGGAVLAFWTDDAKSNRGEGWGTSQEGQFRWTPGAWSLGAGVLTSSFSATNPYLQSYAGPDGEVGTSDDFSDQYDYEASTLGFFLEPRLVVGVFGDDRFGLYLYARVSTSRLTENESGQRPAQVSFTPPGTPPAEAYLVDITRTGLGGYLGSGLLVRLAGRVNLDLGVTGGVTSWGESNRRVEPDFGGWNSSKSAFGFGAWVGLLIGIG